MTVYYTHPNNVKKLEVRYKILPEILTSDFLPESAPTGNLIQNDPFVEYGPEDLYWAERAGRVVQEQGMLIYGINFPAPEPIALGYLVPVFEEPREFKYKVISRYGGCGVL